MGGSRIQLVQRLLIDDVLQAPLRAHRAGFPDVRCGWRTGTPEAPWHPSRLHPARGPALSQTGDAILSALMAQAQAGEKAAYAALLRAVVPVAAAVARRQGVPSEQVDDVVQEVLLTLHRARATYDPRRPFLPWLRAIAQRRAVDALRSRGRGPAREVQDEIAYMNEPSPEHDRDAALDAAADAGRLQAAIATLPPGQRQAVELLALQEQTLAEAANATGRSAGALKVNLHRAVAALRRKLLESGRE